MPWSSHSLCQWSELANLCVTKWLLLHLHPKSPTLTGNLQEMEFWEMQFSLAMLTHCQMITTTSLFHLVSLCGLFALSLTSLVHRVTCVLCVMHFAKCLMYIISFTPHSHPVGCVYYYPCLQRKKLPVFPKALELEDVTAIVETRF